MGWRLKKAEVLYLRSRHEVVEAARRLNAHGGITCEREEKARREALIKAKILNGEMRPFTWALAEVKEYPHERECHRVDGQHSSTVFLGFGDEEWQRVRFPVVVFWEEQECDTIGDLPTLFEQYNPPWSSRSAEDLVGVHAGIHADLLPLLKDRYVSVKTTAGLSWHAVKLEGKPKGSQFQAMHDNDVTHAFLLWCASFLQKRKTEEMLHKVVLGAMRHVFPTAEDGGRTFWENVALGKTRNEEEKPAYKLAVFLELLADSHAEWPRPISKHFHGKTPSEVQIFATCLTAYRSDRLGRRVGDVFEPSKGDSIKDVAARHDAQMGRRVVA